MRSNNEILKTRKDSLARLLATEDLVIEHKKVPTAYFEVDNRKLVCPILKEDMSAQLYDLFMGHEVGHALITPADGWHDAVSEKGAKYKGYLNVLEDVRIEKHIKSKYAGLRKIFYDAYSELHNDLDFFGVKGYDVNKLAFIDRINLYFKIGHSLMVDFSPEEQKIINQIDTKMDTWEKVVKVADYLYELSKLEELQQQTDTNAMSVETAEGDGDAIPQDFDERENDEGESEQSLGGNQESDNEAEEETDGEKGTESGNESDEDGDEESDNESTGEGDIETEKSQNLKGGEGEGGESGNAKVDDNANESITDKNFRNNEDKLHKDLERWDSEPSYMDLNTKDFQTKDITIGYKQVISDITTAFSNYMKEYDASTDTIANSREYTQKFFDFNKNIINYMAKEFDMRKAADAYKKSMSAKTGEIDMSKIHQYLLKDDIFKRATIVPDGKNHGLIMLVDWSGSMYDAIRETYEQSLVLTMFARRVGIPHRVYAFTDAWRSNEDYDSEDYRKEGFNPNKSLRLIELFTDKMNKRDFFEAAVCMNASLESMCDGGYYRMSKGSRFEASWGSPNNYQLGGTPLDESLVFIRDYIADFKHNYSIDKLQFVTLTDGESFRMNGFKGYSNDQFIHDRRTKTTYKYRGADDRNRNGTDNLLKWIEQTTGVDTVGFFICPNKHREFDYAVDKFSGDYQSWETKAEGYKLFRKEGGFSVPTTENSGYKEFYLLNKKKMGIIAEDDTLDVKVGASKQALKGAMKRMGNNKMSQRKILQHFVKKVA